MKRLMITMVMMMTIAISAAAMSYRQARSEALFLTDKMAYELSLTDEQYEAAYEINLDYLMSVNSRSDLYSLRWDIRNRDLRYVLDNYQYSLYVDANYFYRPLSWLYYEISFNIYRRYADRDLYYRSRPSVYFSYRGGNTVDYYANRSFSAPRSYGNRMQPEMSNNRNVNFNSNNSSNRSFGNGRQEGMSSFGNNNSQRQNNTFSNNNSSRRYISSSNNGRQQSSSSFGGASRSMGNNQMAQARVSNSQSSQNPFGGRR
jgi:hypothetical protein